MLIHFLEELVFLNIQDSILQIIRVAVVNRGQDEDGKFEFKIETSREDGSTERVGIHLQKHPPRRQHTGMAYRSLPRFRKS